MYRSVGRERASCLQGRLQIPLGLSLAMSSPAGPSRPRLRTAPPADHEADSHALVARLSLQDIDDLQSQTAPQPGTPRSDREVALALFAQDARSSIVFQRDRALAARLQAEESARVGVVDANPPTFLR